jgi:SAM-dependent methyltransferase
MAHKNHATGLMSKLYAYWHPHLEEEEKSFYREEIKASPGKALELACGGGRLILPFLSEGLAVEGVEASLEMVAVLHRKAGRAGLKPVIYQQRIDALEIQGPYNLIYIPLGSFQLIADPHSPLVALHKYYELLEKGGRLIIPLFLPWAENLMLTPEWQIVSDIKVKDRKERYIQRESHYQDPVEQIIQSKIRFEVWHDKDLLEMVEKEFSLRWYSKREFEYLLREAGFSSIEMRRSYRQGEVLPSFMLFIATK